MKIVLKKRPKNPVVIEGFPGFGLIGTIATEFLIKHLNAQPIGQIWSEGLLPIAAIHESKVVEPLGIFYAQKQNLVIIHALSGVNGLEWDLAQSVIELCKILNAKELIGLEGIGSPEGKLNTYYYSTDLNKKKAFEKIGLLPLKEGIVMGVTGAMMLKAKALSCIFVESHVSLADSKGAAKIIEVLDKYLGLAVDYKPLVKSAEKFEDNLKQIIAKGKSSGEMHRTKQRWDYMG